MKIGVNVLEKSKHERVTSYIYLQFMAIYSLGAPLINPPKSLNILCSIDQSLRHY
jgi:hypothetical protein